MNSVFSKPYMVGALVVVLAGTIAAIVLWRLILSEDTVDAQAIVEDACEELNKVTSNVDFDITTSEIELGTSKSSFDVRWNRKNRIHFLEYDDEGNEVYESITVGLPPENTSDGDSGIMSNRTVADEIEYTRARNDLGQWGNWEIPIYIIVPHDAQAFSDGSKQSNSELLFCGEMTEAEYIGSETIQGIQTSYYKTVFSPGGPEALNHIERDVWIADGRLVQVRVHLKTGKDTAMSYTSTYLNWGEPNIIVAPVTGTLHEAFITTGASGGALGYTDSAGSLDPPGFTTIDGTATEIQELKWQDGAVSLTLAPHDPLTGYVLDFFDVEGEVSLSLDAAFAAADAAAGTLSWPVSAAPWADGDYLMLRIRETGSQPILPLAPVPPMPTATPEPTATPTSM